ncbi:MAG: hypothetical protein ACJAS1_005418 [Oleiphilaceae bacterium]|jgi:hypothetical protein
MSHKNNILAETIPMFLTLIIAVSAAASTFFAYKTAQIASDQQAREHRQEIREVVTLFTSLFEAYQETKEEPAK